MLRKGIINNHKTDESALENIGLFHIRLATVMSHSIFIF